MINQSVFFSTTEMKSFMGWTKIAPCSLRHGSNADILFQESVKLHLAQLIVRAFKPFPWQFLPKASRSLQMYRAEESNSSPTSWQFKKLLVLAVQLLHLVRGLPRFTAISH